MALWRRHVERRPAPRRWAWPGGSSGAGPRRRDRCWPPPCSTTSARSTPASAPSAGWRRRGTVGGGRRSAGRTAPQVALYLQPRPHRRRPAGRGRQRPAHRRLGPRAPPPARALDRPARRRPTPSRPPTTTDGPLSVGSTWPIGVPWPGLRVGARPMPSPGRSAAALGRARPTSAVPGSAASSANAGLDRPQQLDHGLGRVGLERAVLGVVAGDSSGVRPVAPPELEQVRHARLGRPGRSGPRSRCR